MSGILRGALLVVLAMLVTALGFDLINGFPYGLTYDDGYFYAQIAYNLGESGRSSFDGFSTTSGYHLLWGGLLGLVSAALAPFTVNKAAHLYAFEVVFVALALGAAFRFHVRSVERLCVLALVMLGTLLMETLLLSCLLLALAREQTEIRPVAVERPWRAFVLAFLVPLTRIDAAVILVVYAVLLLAFDRERRRALRLLLAVSLGILTQLALMLLFFGRPFSVSSMIKARNAAPFGATLWTSFVGPEAIAVGYVVRALLCVGLATVVTFLCVSERQVASNRRLLYLGLGATVFSAAHFVSQLMPFWCYLPAYLVLFFALTQCRLERPALNRVRSLAVAVTAALGLALAAHKLHIYWAHLDIVRGARDFVAAIQRCVPPQGRIYQIDGSGFTGFFSERSVVNGDGLVNSYEYARRMQEGRLDGFLDEAHICYLILNRRPGPDALVDFGGLRVASTDVESLLRSTSYGRFATTDFALYRRRTPSCALVRRGEALSGP